MPYMLIIGEKEITDGTVSVRDRATDQTETMTLEALIAKLEKEIKERKSPMPKGRSSREGTAGTERAGGRCPERHPMKCGTGWTRRSLSRFSAASTVW